MRGIAGSSLLILKLLAFCGPGLKMVVVAGLFFFALSPILELYLVKLIADFILGSLDDMSQPMKIFSVAKILGLLVVVYGLRYTVKVGRISFVNHLMGELEERATKPSPWLRAALIEQSQIMAVFIQLVAMAAVCFYIDVVLGGAFLLILGLSYSYSSRQFLKQLHLQRKFRFNKKTPRHELANQKVYQRVRAQELASAFSSFTAALMLVVLLIMIAFGSIEPVTALVGLFLVRLYNITLGMFAGSVMRMARALAYVDSSMLPRSNIGKG